MQDNEGNELAVGDKVVYIQQHYQTQELFSGEVIGFTPKKIRIKDEGGYTDLKIPAHVIKK